MVLEKSVFALNAIKLEVTHRCQLKCIHCSSNANPCNSPVMQFKLATDILEQAIAMGVKEVCFSGGEPLLWEGIADAISLCTSAGVYTQVYTSGNLDGVEVSMELLREKNTSKLIFSIYGGKGEYHDKITEVRGSFDKTMGAVDQAIAAGLDVEFHFVPLSTNYKELGDVIRLARNKGVEQVSILRFVPQGRGENHPGLALNHRQNLELKKIVERNRSEAKIRAGSPYNFLMINDSPSCSAGIDRLSILPDSTIYPCDAFKQVKAERIVGTDEFSRLDRWSVRECWEKSPYLRTIREYLKSPFEQPCCACEYLGMCLSGCLAQKYIANGSLKKVPDPMCLRRML